MHKLNRAAIFLERLMYFGITFGCGTKIDVSSFGDVFEIVCVVDFTPHQFLNLFINLYPLGFSECSLLIFTEKGKGTPKCFCPWLGPNKFYCILAM